LIHRSHFTEKENTNIMDSDCTSEEGKVAPSPSPSLTTASEFEEEDVEDASSSDDSEFRNDFEDAVEAVLLLLSDGVSREAIACHLMHMLEAFGRR